MEKTLASKILFKGRLITLRLDEVKTDSGALTQREILVHPGAVAILPVLSPNEIVLIKQFRKALEKDIYEIPAGTLEPGEAPLSCAKRELQEECGYKSEHLSLLFSFYPAPGYSSELIHLFVAKDLIKTEQQLESDEKIEPFSASKEEVKKLLHEGKIQDAKTLIAIADWLGSFGSR